MIERLLKRLRPADKRRLCPAGDDLLLVVEGAAPTGVLAHVERCALCRSEVEFIRESAFVTLPQIRKGLSLPKFLKNALATEFGSAPACPPLTVLHAVGWAPARLTSGILPRFLPLPTRSTRLPKKAVPVVAGEVAIVARDSRGKRMAKAKGFIEGPFRGRTPRKGKSPAERRAIRFDGRGVFKDDDLPPGRYLLSSKGQSIEFEVKPRKEGPLP